jgi:glycosyltransferase involved in cell wall biosynthesis
LESLKRITQTTALDKITDKDTFLVVYVGGMEIALRGLQELINAFKYIQNPKIILLLIGDGVLRSELERRVETEGLESKIKFMGWKPFGEAMYIIKKSDLCLLPHRPIKMTNLTLPHKIFQYCGLEKIVISSDLKPIRKLFQDTIIYWKPRTPRNLAKIIESIASDNRRYFEMAKKANLLVIEKYNWKCESTKLKKLYNQVFFTR